MWVEGAGFLTSMAPCTGLRSFKGEEGYKTLSLYSGGFYAGLWGGGGDQMTVSSLEVAAEMAVRTATMAVVAGLVGGNS